MTLRHKQYASSTVTFAFVMLVATLYAGVTTLSPSSQYMHFPIRQKPEIQKMTRVEIEGYTIGDEHRSETSSASFFSSIDRDGDGTLRRPELSSFIRDRIGGEPFDTHEEREREIESVLTRLDLNANGLDEVDVMSYWKKNLDGLLGVEDVAEWLVHAVQLPHEDVESKFCHNHVTGYDFPELVENNGDRLRTELGVTNSRHLNKIMSLVNARMVGIESNLPKIQLNTPEVKCTRVKLTWKKVESKSGFPVHKYRIQRLAVPMEMGSSVYTYIAPAEGVRGRPCRDSSKPVDNWETVYDGMENEYVDCNIETGFDYTYRIEAWNALGRSPWVSITPEQGFWEGRKCQRKSGDKLANDTAVPRKPDADSWSNFHFFVYFCSFLKQLSYVAMMLVGYVWKLQRENGFVTRNPYFTSVRNVINKIGLQIWGHEVIPEKIDMKKRATKIGINGIAGCDNLLRESDSISPTSPKSQTIYPSVRFTIQSQRENDKSLSGKKEKKKKKKPIPYIDEQAISEEYMYNVSGLTIPSEIEENGLHKEDSTIATIATTRDTDDSPVAVVVDDPRRCAICVKKFKWHRRRHHCSKCFVTFCGKHGNCTHPVGTPCPVRGSCVCNNCL